MSVERWHAWDVVYGILLLIAVPVVIFHAAQDRWPQAILATAAAVTGALILFTGWLRETDEEVERQRAAAPSGESVRARVEAQPQQRTRVDEPVPRENGRVKEWAFLGVIAGFVGTGAMTGVLLLGYAIAALFGSNDEGASTVQVWLTNLIDNTVTEVTLVNIPLALGIHIVAGIAWAIIYAGIFEPRLSGPGPRRGVIFSLLPWFLSMAIFLPVVGGGFFGVNVEAGPLPAVGNLILHLAYGAAIGSVLSSRWVLTQETQADIRYQEHVLARSQRTTAVSLVAGMVFGLFVGLLGAGIFAPGADPFLVSVIAALIGSVVGVLVGSIAGLNPEEQGSEHHATSSR